MSSEPIKKALKDFGLTEKETEIYIILAKHGVLTGGEISKQTKMHRPHIYRILKKLQNKGVVESTLESPTRFTAVPFETILDLNIRAKREEVALIEKTKKHLLEDWKRISRIRFDPELAKFTVMKGSRKIYSKIAEMIKKTRNKFSTMATVAELGRAEQFGVFESAYNHPLRSTIQFRFVTELSKEKLPAMKLLRNTIKAGLKLKVRNPELGPSLFPRMAIRDEEEILFFISPKIDSSITQKDEVCLCTNSRSLVQTFIGVFEDLWRTSTPLEERITEIETGKPAPKAYLIIDAEKAEKKYHETLNMATKEVWIVTSSKGLVELSKNKELLEEMNDRDISIRIMAPIIGENFEALQQLLNSCEVRHIPKGYLESTIIDGHHLFQFKYPPSHEQTTKAQFSFPFFRNVFYTNDLNYVEKTRTMLYDIWKNSRTPSSRTLESILRSTAPTIIPVSSDRMPHEILEKSSLFHRGIQLKPSGAITEKDVLNKIATGKRYPSKNWKRKVVRFYGFSAFAFLNPPDHFNLPNMIISVHHNDKNSSFGVGDRLNVLLWLDTPNGFSYVPVAHVLNNPRVQEFRRSVFSGTPAAENMQLVNKDELQIQMHGNNVFAGWTQPIPLLFKSYSIPPSCMLFEGYGEVRSGGLTNILPSGHKAEVEFNCLEAFITYFHPSSKYSGPGTEGFIDRDLILTTFPR